MKRDVIYYFDKDTYERHELGEVQNEFNMAFAIDGTKDSTKLIILSYSVKKAVDPLTILYHEATDTWWVVDKDDTMTYFNEDADYESNYLYKHTIQLSGARELLNARDLTDCGFNQNTYTISSFLQRLIKLSSFEFKTSYLIVRPSYGGLDIDKNIDYNKTFENYTLLSAIREFLDGYNYTFKLTFETTAVGNKIKLNRALFNLYPKTGSFTIVGDLDYFDDARENESVNKESFGTSVVSNAQNVISTITKTYPSSGAVRLTGESYTITGSSAVIRLPANVFNVNWIRMYYENPMVMRVYQRDGSGWVLKTIWQRLVRCEEDVESIFNTFANTVRTNYSQDAYDDMIANKNVIMDNMAKSSRCTFYNGMVFNPTNQAWENPNNVPNARTIRFGGMHGIHPAQTDLISFSNKESRDYSVNPWRTIYYDRGSNMIKGFDFFDKLPTDKQQGVYVWEIQDTDLMRNMGYSTTGTQTLYGADTGTYYVTIQTWCHRIVEDGEYIVESWRPTFLLAQTTWQVNYTPMTDVKIKVDNSGTSHDMQLYNQNGKLTDGNALSKLLVSYSKEIESSNITRYKNFYDYAQVPQVGSSFKSGNDLYVVNNVSLTFVPNEGSDSTKVYYFIEGEFSLSKKIATKSLMTNPNTNIRDYGIPQNNNVKRKQLYRDFYELSKDFDEDSSYSYYLHLYQTLNLGVKPILPTDHIGVIKVSWGDTNYYYQLDSIFFQFKKSIYEIIDFNDNNIIGYSAKNTTGVFDLSQLSSYIYGTNTNVPVSYVNDEGRFDGVYVAFTTKEQLRTVYTSATGNEQTASSVMSVVQCYIPAEIYEGGYDEIVIIEEDTSIFYGDWEAQTTMFISLDITSEIQDNLTPVDQISVILTQVIGGTPPDTNYTIDFTIGEIYQDINNRYYVKIYKNDFFTGYTSLNFGVKVSVTQKMQLFAGAKDVCDFLIQEPEYKKDALEVPVFEYCCQLDDSDTVLIGDDIFQNDVNDITYLYYITLVPKANNCHPSDNSGIITNLEVFAIPPEDGSSQVVDTTNPKNNGYEIRSGFTCPQFNFNLVDGHDVIEIFSKSGMTVGSSGTTTYGDPVLWSNTQDYNFVIVRVAITQNSKISQTTYNVTDFNLQKIIIFDGNCFVNQNKAILHINHYKV